MGSAACILLSALFCAGMSFPHSASAEGVLAQPTVAISYHTFFDKHEKSLANLGRDIVELWQSLAGTPEYQKADRLYAVVDPLIEQVSSIRELIYIYYVMECEQDKSLVAVDVKLNSNTFLDK